MMHGQKSIKLSKNVYLAKTPSLVQQILMS